MEGFLGIVMIAEHLKQEVKSDLIKIYMKTVAPQHRPSDRRVMLPLGLVLS